MIGEKKMIEMNVITIVFSTIFYCWLVLFHILILGVITDIRKNQEKINILLERQIRKGEIIRFK